jgi:hypothetical protein
MPPPNEAQTRVDDGLAQDIERNGYATASGLLREREVGTISRALERLGVRGAGSRNMLRQPWCRALALRLKARLTNAGAMPSSHVAVQCTLFDKTPHRNWLVALHQDLSIPVRARVGHPSWSVWSEKEGELFVQAPVKVLESLLAVRVHVDDCGPDNGPLRVVPGSHRRGRVSGATARALRSALGEEPCLVKRGDALLMRPLVLHASSKAVAPLRRRVLHFVFGPPALPHGLEWRHTV